MSAENKPKELTKNHVRVSSKKSKFVYVDIVKYLLNEGEDHVDVSGLGIAMSDVADIIEILKAQDVVNVTKIETSHGSEGNHNALDRLCVSVVKSANFRENFDAQQKAKEERNAKNAKSASN